MSTFLQFKDFVRSDSNNLTVNEDESIQCVFIGSLGEEQIVSVPRQDLVESNLLRTEQILDDAGPSGIESRNTELDAIAKDSKKSVIWNDSTTKLLLAEYSKRKFDFRDSKKKKRNVWAEIREVFEGRGYDVSYDDLDRKFRNLKHHYKTIVDNKKKTGRGRLHWEHFESMQEIFVGDETVHAPPTISSAISNATAALFNNPNTIAEAVKKVNEIETPSTAQNTQSTSGETPRRRDIAAKAKGSKALYLQRKTMIEMEKERITILDRIAKQLETSNDIQKKRNDLLEEYINMQKK